MRPDAVTTRRFTGSVGEFHHRSTEGVDGVELWVFDVERPAVVLGSRQTPAVLDVAACERAGVEIAKRRSGGGVVLLEPGAVCWVDVVVPRTAPWWSDDVVESMLRCGEVWCDALSAINHVSPLDAPLGVYRGPLQRGTLADLVCFAGFGPGEVTAGAAKLAGISQRRTRHVARFQCAVHHRWSPERLAQLLAPDVVDRDELLALPVATSTATDQELVDMFAASWLRALPAG